jgi:hypothetical protein
MIEYDYRFQVNLVLPDKAEAKDLQSLVDPDIFIIIAEIASRNWRHGVKSF